MLVIAASRDSVLDVGAMLQCLRKPVNARQAFLMLTFAATSHLKMKRAI
jgi:hypothetical protein